MMIEQIAISVFNVARDHIPLAFERETLAVQLHTSMSSVLPWEVNTRKGHFILHTECHRILVCGLEMG